MVVESLSQHLITLNMISTPHSGPLVISARIMFMVKRILIDIEIFINLITLDIFDKLGLDQKKNLSKVSYPLVGLGDKLVPVIGVTNLIVVVGDEKFKREIYTEFTVVDIPLSYNSILGWPILNNYRIIFNMEYLCLKLPIEGGIAVARGSQDLSFVIRRVLLNLCD